MKQLNQHITSNITVKRSAKKPNQNIQRTAQSVTIFAVAKIRATLGCR